MIQLKKKRKKVVSDRLFRLSELTMIKTDRPCSSYQIVKGRDQNRVGEVMSLVERAATHDSPADVTSYVCVNDNFI